MKNSVSIVLRVLLVVFIVLLLINYVRLVLFGSGNSVTFSSFLDLVENFRSQFSLVNLVNFQNLQISGSWGLLDGIRIFINSLVAIFTTAMYFCLNLLDIIHFIAYFLGYVFVV